MDLMGINTGKQTLNIKTGGSLGFRDHALVEYAVLADTSQVRKKVMPLNFRKANFYLFRETVNKIHCETSLRDKEVKEI